MNKHINGFCIQSSCVYVIQSLIYSKKHTYCHQGLSLKWNNLFLLNKCFNIWRAENVKDKASLHWEFWSIFELYSILLVPLDVLDKSGSGAHKQHRKLITHCRKLTFFYWVLSKPIWSLLMQPGLLVVSRWDHPIILERKTKIYLLSQMPQFVMFSM